MGEARTCHNCGVRQMDLFHQVQSVPVNSCILLASREEAQAYPRGDIDLAFCPNCGFVSNTGFDQMLTEYSERYEETQGFSPTFNAFHRDLATRLMERYSLYGKDIIEIGCGKGEFLNLLCERGRNRGIGFDPGYIDGRNEPEQPDRVTIIRDFYSERYSAYQGDFLCCKMTLEHIHATEQFLAMVRRAIGDRKETIVFFQVPDATRILRECAFEDVYYEHCSYFTPGSLAYLFRAAAFEIIDLSTEYDDQYLTIEARAGNDKNHAFRAEQTELDNLRKYVAEFSEKLRNKQAWWKQKFEELKNSKVVLWGSGSKAVSFLTTLTVGDAIDYVVDINPFRQGHFMPGSGHKIVGPDFLRKYKPDVVVIMNRIYYREIETDLVHMGLAPQIVAL